MHEMSLCESVMQILEETSAQQGFAKVKTVWLEIGELAGVETEAMRFSFEVIRRGTLADQAALEIINVPGSAWCMPCGKNVRIAQRFDACPDCGSYQLQVNGGDEMRIKELEVE